MALVYLIASLGGGGDYPRCDVVEINHYMNEDGTCHFTQVIAWDWAYDYHAKQCQGWRMVDEWWRTRTGIKAIDNGGREFQLNAPSFIETWTDYDPELRNRKLHPEKYRRKVW